MRIGLWIPRFTWPATPIGSRLAEIGEVAEQVGFESIWVMDHFFQIPTVGEVGEPMLQSYERPDGLAVTYLLSVYPLMPRKLALAVSLNQETAGRADGVAIAACYVVPGRFETIGERLRMLNDEMLYLAYAHSFFPVLYYKRPRNVHESTPACSSSCRAWLRRYAMVWTRRGTTT